MDPAACSRLLPRALAFSTIKETHSVESNQVAIDTLLLNTVHIILSVCESFFFPIMNRLSLYIFWVKKQTKKHKNWVNQVNGLLFQHVLLFSLVDLPWEPRPVFSQGEYI